MSGKFEQNIYFISDVHLLHPLVKTKHTLERLRKAFPDSKAMARIDAIFISGDLFDGIGDVPSEELWLIKQWIRDFLYMAKKWNVVVRKLYGTKSHDRDQGVLLEQVNALSDINADFRYIRTVCVEHIESLGLDVLYVPDEWRSNPDDTWLDVQEALRVAGVEKVHYACMHGEFEFQLPFPNAYPCHNAERYLSIVTKYIDIGHNHKHAIFDRIISNGSFDRLKHGEEEDKGHILIRSRSETGTENDEVIFIPNKDATRFATYDLQGLDREQVSDRLAEITHDHQEGDFIRLFIERDSLLRPMLKSIQHRRPEFNWKVETKTETLKKLPSLKKTQTFKAVDLHPDTICSEIENRLTASGVSDLHRTESIRLFKEACRDILD